MFNHFCFFSLSFVSFFERWLNATEHVQYGIFWLVTVAVASTICMCNFVFFFVFYSFNFSTQLNDLSSDNIKPEYFSNRKQRHNDSCSGFVVFFHCICALHFVSFRSSFLFDSYRKFLLAKKFFYRCCFTVLSE